MSSIFNHLIYQPLFNALIIFYNFIPDLGVAIIGLTIIIRIALLPVSKKSIESQKKMQEIQPEIKKIQEKYKNDKQRQGEELMKFYKEKGINPAGGCLPMIIQIVILIALYRVFMAGVNFSGDGQLLYSFVTNPKQISQIAFGFLDLGAKNIYLAVIAGALQFWQTKMIMAKKNKQQSPTKKETGEPNFGEIMQQQMLYVGPLMSFFFGATFPAGLPLYWITTTLFMIGQQYWIIKKDIKNNPVAN